MNERLKKAIEHLRSNFEEIDGAPFHHFYCPILFRDENVELCEGHIVNQAFRDSPRAWTVQRKDVDGFFGAHFESAFVDVQTLQEATFPDMISDKASRGRLRPRLFADTREVAYYLAGSESVPDGFVRMEVEGASRPTILGLKMSPESLEKEPDDRWHFEVSLDVRLSATVSLIKAAHLTLFRMLGYRYALSAAGRYVGFDILGDFFIRNQRALPNMVQDNAIQHFSQFVNMVRPMKPGTASSPGTVVDGSLLTCWASSGSPWAFIVFIKTGDRRDAVMLPIFDSEESIATYLGFLKSTQETVTVGGARYADGRWALAKEHRQLTWEKRTASLS